MRRTLLLAAGVLVVLATPALAGTAFTSNGVNHDWQDSWQFPNAAEHQVMLNQAITIMQGKNTGLFKSKNLDPVDPPGVDPTNCNVAGACQFSTSTSIGNQIITENACDGGATCSGAAGKQYNIDSTQKATTETTNGGPTP